MADRPPSIVFVMADDHAAHAIGAYGSRINETPGIDRLAAEGMRFDACFCTNSICSPSCATMLTGTYNHVNGVTTLDTRLHSLHADPVHAAAFDELRAELRRLSDEVGDIVPDEDPRRASLRDASLRDASLRDADTS
jgi:arylsulfatase A-like enzyme